MAIHCKPVSENNDLWMSVLGELRREGGGRHVTVDGNFTTGLVSQQRTARLGVFENTGGDRGDIHFRLGGRGGGSNLAEM